MIKIKKILNAFSSKSKTKNKSKTKFGNLIKRQQQQFGWMDGLPLSLSLSAMPAPYLLYGSAMSLSLSLSLSASPETPSVLTFKRRRLIVNGLMASTALVRTFCVCVCYDSYYKF